MTSSDPLIKGQVQPKKANIRIFTDGSAQEGSPSGSGVHVEVEGKLIETFSYNVGEVDIKLAEIYALKKAGQWIIRNGNYTVGQNVDIYCDSQAAIHSVNAIKTRSETTVRTMHVLNGAGKVCNLTIRWVKSHSTSIGNANADRAANKGRTLPYVVYDAPKISWAALMNNLVGGVNNLWNTLWDKEQAFRQTKQWFPEIDPKRSYDIHRLKRVQWGKLCQFITGHNSLNRHLFLTEVDPELESAQCTKCGYGDMTSSHIMGNCPRFWRERGEIFSNYYLSPPFKLPIGQVLHFMKRIGVEPLKWDD